MARTTQQTTRHTAARTKTNQAANRARAERPPVPARTETNKTEPGKEPDKKGGISIGAAFFGWLVATALAAIFAALISAGGVSLAVSQIEQNAGGVLEILQTISIAAGILMLVVLAVAYFAGGYVAGRMAPHGGALQGVGVWITGIVITLLLALAGALFGSSYNIAQQLNLPRIPIDEGALTTNGLIYLVIAVAISLAAAIAGSKLGQRYFARAGSAGPSMR